MALKHPDQQADEEIIAITRNPDLYGRWKTARILPVAYDEKNEVVRGAYTIVVKKSEMEEKGNISPCTAVPASVLNPHRQPHKPLVPPLRPVPAIMQERVVLFKPIPRQPPKTSVNQSQKLDHQKISTHLVLHEDRNLLHIHDGTTVLVTKGVYELGLAYCKRKKIDEHDAGEAWYVLLETGNTGDGFPVQVMRKMHEDGSLLLIEGRLPKKYRQ